MAETSDRNAVPVPAPLSSVQEQELGLSTHRTRSILPTLPEEPHLPSAGRNSEEIDGDAQEDTALRRLRIQYSRASSSRQRGSGTAATKKPTTLLERFTYTVSTFWRRQISITVPHSTCRDHLGMLLHNISTSSFPLICSCFICSKAICTLPALCETA